jgi:hypothetical protein
MSIERINLGPAAPIGGARDGGTSALVDVNARTVASTVVGRIASELALAHSDGPLTGAGGDLYGLGALADAIGGQLGATPTETGELQRALESFAGAVAADLTAMADGRTFERVDAALGQLSIDEAGGVGAVTQSLETAAAAIAEAR